MIVFFHLLNDRSGSPRVLASAMAALAGPEQEQILYVSDGTGGFLDKAAPDVRRYAYRRGRNRWHTLVAYLRSQFELLTQLLGARDIPGQAIFYVNTVLPFAAALYGRLSGRKVVYHLHEVSISPAPLRWLLMGVVRCTAARIICVSEFHRKQLRLRNSVVVLNAIDAGLYDRATSAVYQPRRNGVFRVSMLCALRDYKGVPELLGLAGGLVQEEHVRFQLVVNDTPEAVKRYFAGRDVSRNVELLQGVSDPSAVYERSSLVLNLSRVDQCLETFGLTLLEAMSFGVPVIAPPAGGPAELVRDGVEGFLVDSRDAERLRGVVSMLASSDEKCFSLSEAGRRRAQQFSPDRFRSALRQAVLGGEGDSHV